MKNQGKTTMMLKSKFSNQVNDIINPEHLYGPRKYWDLNKQIQAMSTEQKLEMLDKIIKAHKECSQELGSYQYARREQKRINKARVARGKFPKKKTTKAEYEQTQKDAA